jgi:hypothetical protein
VRQVGYLQELNRSTPSTEHKIPDLCELLLRGMKVGVWRAITAIRIAGTVLLSDKINLK